MRAPPHSERCSRLSKLGRLFGLTFQVIQPGQKATVFISPLHLLVDGPEAAAEAY